MKVKSKLLLAAFALSILVFVGCKPSRGASLSTSTAQPSNPAAINLDGLEGITERYVRPLNPSGRILLSTWEKPDDIKASDLIQFCAFNHLLNKEPGTSGSSIMDGADDAGHDGAASDVEKAIQQYFDVSVAHLRTAPEYESEKAGHYFIGDGFGGGGAVTALDAKMNGNILIVRVGVYGPDDAENPAKTGNLRISLSSDSYQYLSYVLEQ